MRRVIRKMDGASSNYNDRNEKGNKKKGWSILKTQQNLEG